jgi:hypothetical protein
MKRFCNGSRLSSNTRGERQRSAFSPSFTPRQELCGLIGSVRRTSSKSRVLQASRRPSNESSSFQHQRIVKGIDDCSEEPTASDDHPLFRRPGLRKLLSINEDPGERSQPGISASASKSTHEGSATGTRSREGNTHRRTDHTEKMGVRRGMRRAVGVGNIFEWRDDTEISQILTLAACCTNQPGPESVPPFLHSAHGELRPVSKAKNYEKSTVEIDHGHES